jgi:hypothetical protein
MLVSAGPLKSVILSMLCVLLMNLSFKKWKLNVFIFYIKLRMHTIFTEIYTSHSDVSIRTVPPKCCKNALAALLHFMENKK